MINQKPITGKILDGIDISPEWKGLHMPTERPLYWHFPIYLEAYAGAKDEARDTLFRTRPGSIMRMENWKLHHYFEDPPDKAWELYNLKTDPGERNNLIQEQTTLSRELIDQMQKWLENTHAPIPSIRNPVFGPLELDGAIKKD